MSYGGARSYLVSNPQVAFMGRPVGIERTASGGSADNAYVWNANAKTISAYYADSSNLYWVAAERNIHISQGTPAVRERITLFNDGPQTEVTLSAQGGWFSVPEAVTIPANGSVEVEVSVDPNAHTTTATGNITATAGSKQVTIALTIKPMILNIDYTIPQQPITLTQDQPYCESSFVALIPHDKHWMIEVYQLQKPLFVTKARLTYTGRIEYFIGAPNNVDIPSGKYPITARVFDPTTSYYVHNDIDVIGFKASNTTRDEFVNLSTRGFVGSGEDAMIGGVVIGDAPVKLLVKGVGPSLLAHGITNAITDPRLLMHTAQGVLVGSSLDWANEAQAQELRTLFPVVGSETPPDTEAALLVTLQPGAYTFNLEDQHGAQGVGMIELYRVNDPLFPGRMINLSTRARVGKGGDILIAGFVRTGARAYVLARGVGPKLMEWGLTNALVDPLMAVFDNTNTKVMELDDWSQSGLDADDMQRLVDTLGAESLTRDCKDASEIINVTAGSTTIQVTGKANFEGIGLVEVYEIP
jgi:hypothetical protein